MLPVFNFPRIEKLPSTEVRMSYEAEDEFERKRKEDPNYPFNSKGASRLASWMEKASTTVSETKELLDILREDFRVDPGFKSKRDLENLWFSVPTLVHHFLFLFLFILQDHTLT